MATHSSTLAQKIPRGRSLVQATVHGVTKESDMTEQLHIHLYIVVGRNLHFTQVPLVIPVHEILESHFEKLGNTSLMATFRVLDFPGGSDGKASAYNAGDLGSIPWWRRSSGKGNSSPLQYPCLKNPMGGAWQATVHRVAKSHKELDTTE